MNITFYIENAEELLFKSSSRACRRILGVQLKKKSSRTSTIKLLKVQTAKFQTVKIRIVKIQIVIVKFRITKIRITKIRITKEKLRRLPAHSETKDLGLKRRTKD